VNQLVLSGTATPVLSGTRSSCYRGPVSSLRAGFSALFRCSNFTNQKSFGFLLTDQAERRGGGDWQRPADSPACLPKPHAHVANPKAHGSQFNLLGATV
jgi:hypothetical protein